MSVKSILFNTDMVREILDGRKTVTRRVIKHNVDAILNSPYHNEHPEVEANQIIRKLCMPPYQPGDILYVRKTWQHIDFAGENNGYVYKASENGKLWETESENWTWKPSMHMPKEAARIFLKVTNVRVERLQCMSWNDICNEGIISDSNVRDNFSFRMLQNKFKNLWNYTIKKSDFDFYGWDANPWVWVIEFERCEKPKGWC